MQCLTFLQTLLTIGGHGRVHRSRPLTCGRRRHRAPERAHRGEKIEELLSTGTLVIEPAPVPAHLTEAVRRFSSRIRARIEAGETVLKETLTEVEAVQRHLDAGKLRIEPARIPAAA